jgi:6-phosphogluconolactonase (cycloisomerase 2 family)
MMTNIHGSAPNTNNFYAAIGDQLTHFHVDIKTATLECNASAKFGLNIQYVWPHPDLNIIYLAVSNGGPGNNGTKHKLIACNLDTKDGTIRDIINSATLPYRPLHLSLDCQKKHILVAYNNPCFISVHQLDPSGSIGSQIKQDINLDGGIFGHQIMATPGGNEIILVCRGFDALNDQLEQPGALKFFNYRDGKLAFQDSIAPNYGIGFGARHLDFHQNGNWIYVAVERQSEIHFLRIDEKAISKTIEQKTSTLSKSVQRGVRQAVSAIHIHPSGNFVYVSNRAYSSGNHASGNTIPNGEDNIATFKIDKKTGRVNLIQNIDTNGSLPRTFSIDPSGRLLIAANSEPTRKKNELGHVVQLPVSLNLFKIGNDGRLEQGENLSFPSRDQLLFWAGFL